MNENEIKRIQQLPIYLDGRDLFAEAALACFKKPELEDKNQFILVVRKSNREEIDEIDGMTVEQIYKEITNLNTFAMAFGDNFSWGCNGNRWLLSLYFCIGDLPLDYYIQRNGRILFDESEAGNRAIKKAAELFKEKLESWPRMEESLLSRIRPEWKPDKEWLRTVLKG